MANGNGRLTVYHGTDYSVAQKIQKEYFTIKQNKFHWLGNGIYFYQDKDLAKWWASSPSKRFGTEIINPAIISAEINLKKANLLDLRTLKGYRECAKCYSEFSDIVCSYYADDKAIDLERLRCCFFDYIMKKNDIDVIIGSFTKKQPYKDEPEIEYLEAVDLGYPEVQICVRADRQRTLIKIVNIEEIDIKGYQNEKT